MSMEMETVQVMSSGQSRVVRIDSAPLLQQQAGLE